MQFLFFWVRILLRKRLKGYKMKKAQSAGIVIIRYEENTPKLLFMRSFNYWDFPKGGVEEKENKLEAAIREVKEESGITHLDFKWGKCFYETESYGKNHKTVCYFIAQTDQENVTMGINPDIGRAEHEEYLWLTFEEAKKLSVDRISKVLDWAENRIKNLYKKEK